MANLKLSGDTSGVITVAAPAAAGTNTLTLPATTGTLHDENSTLLSSNLSGALPAISGASLTAIIKADVAQEYTAQQNFNATTLTYDGTQDWNLSTGQVTKLTLTGNTVFDAPTNQVDGSVYVITIIQDGTGSRTAGWNAVFKFAAATAPTLTTTASAKDIFTFVSDGTNMLCVAQVLNVS